MEAIKQTIPPNTGSLIIKIPEQYINKRIEVIIVPLPDDESSKHKYDFSDLAGHLEWRGNAVNEQRNIRDEW